MKPEISIIVPVYNAEKYLSRCIESILKQTYSNIELILINDGSTDQSAQIMEHYSEIDNRIVIFYQKNKGVSEARNAGLRLANGKYIGFVDADDTIEPTMYQILLDAIYQTNANIAITNWYNIENENRRIFAKFEQTEKYLSLNIEELLEKVYFEGQTWLLYSIWSKLIEAELAKKVCFEPALLFGEDTWYSYQVLTSEAKMVIVSEPLYNYYIHSGSASHGGIVGEKKIGCVEVYKSMALDMQTKGYISLAHVAYAYYLDLVLLQINYSKDDLVYQRALKKIFKKQAVGIIKCKAISVKLKIAYLIHIIKL